MTANALIALGTGSLIVLAGVTTIAAYYTRSRPIPRPSLRPSGRVCRCEFPHGLRCGQCSRPMPEGTPYWAVPDGVADGYLLEVIVCSTCAAICTEVPA